MKYLENFSRWSNTLVIGLLVFFSGLIVTAVILSYNEKTGPFKTMILEANKLDLNYDQVVNEPDKFLEKYVIWSVVNISKSEVYYRGDLSRPITVFNHQQMPLSPKYKRVDTVEMLLQIKGAMKTDSGSGKVGVMFISAL